MTIRTKVISSFEVYDKKTQPKADSNSLKVLATLSKDNTNIEATVTTILGSGNAVLTSNIGSFEVRDARNRLSRSDQLTLKSIYGDDGRLYVKVIVQNNRQVSKVFEIAGKHNAQVPQGELMDDEIHPQESNVIGKQFEIKILAKDAENVSSMQKNPSNRIVVRNLENPKDSSEYNLEKLELSFDRQSKSRDTIAQFRKDISSDIVKDQSGEASLIPNSAYRKILEVQNASKAYANQAPQPQGKSWSLGIVDAILEFIAPNQEPRSDVEETINNKLSNLERKTQEGTIIGYSKNNQSAIISTKSYMLEINSINAQDFPVNSKISFEFVSNNLNNQKTVVENPHLSSNLAYKSYVEDFVQSFERNYGILAHVLKYAKELDWNCMQHVIKELNRTYGKATYSIRSGKKSVEDLNRLINTPSEEVASMLSEYNTTISSLRTSLLDQDPVGWVVIKIPQQGDTESYEIRIKEEELEDKKGTCVFFKIDLEELKNLGDIYIEGVLTRSPDNIATNLNMTLKCQDLHGVQNFAKDIQTIFEAYTELCNIKGDIKVVDTTSKKTSSNTMDVDFLT